MMNQNPIASRINKPRWLLALALLPLSLLVYAEEWKDIPNEQVGFEFNGPGLELVQPEFQRRAYHGYTIELGDWRGQQGTLSGNRPHAEIMFIKLTLQGYFFTDENEIPLPEEIMRWLAGRNPAMKGETERFDYAGRQTYQLFALGDVECVGLRRYITHGSGGRWESYSGATLLGNIQFAGYYCATPDTPLDRDTIKRMARSLSVR